jgi:vitamin B12 transporter
MFSNIATERRRMRLSHVLASTLLLPLFAPDWCETARAQAPASPPAALPPIVVVSPTTLPTPVEQTSSSVTVITGAELERDQRRTASDALMTVPGLNVVQNGGPGGLTSVFMRGTNPGHVKVLIDGIDVSDPSNTARTFDFGQLLTNDIERIEVLRGPQSGLYGADAIGGVISITTKKGEGPPKVVGTLETGSFGTFNQSSSISGSTGIFNYAFNVSHFQASSTPVTPLDLLPPGRMRLNDYYDNRTLSTKVGADLSENFALNFVARYTDATLRFTGDDFSVFPSVPAAAQSIQNVRQFYTRGEAVWTLFDGRFKNYFGINYTDTWNLERDPATAFGPTPPTTNAGNRDKFDWRGVAAILPGQTLVMGLEQETERLRTDVTSAENSNAAGYVELQSKYWDRFFLVSNIRYDDNDAFGAHTTYRIAPSVLIPETGGTQLKASYGTGFKAPTLSQLYVSFPAFGFFANPNLKPEQSEGYDIGFEQPLAGDRIRFGVTYFHNDITDLIAANATFTSYTNINQAETSGIEAFVAVAVTDRLKLRGDYTYTKAIDAVTGLELLRRPRDKGSVTAIWNPIDPLTLSGTVLAVGDWVDVNRSGTVLRLTAPGYTLVNLAANYTVNNQVTLFGRVDNLFNVHYEDPTGFERPGFGIYGGIRLANR